MNQNELVDDAVLDAITINSSARLPFSDSFVQVDGPAEVQPVVNLLTSFGRPRPLLNFVMGVLEQSGVAINDTAFFYPAVGLDFGEGLYPGVLIHDPLDQVYARPPAFERLAARFFREVINVATRRRAPTLQQPWWPEFVAAVGQIEQRVASQA